MAKPKLEDCKFYHSVNLPSGETLRGDWDLRDKLDVYIGNVDVKGCRVLDMGTASGALSFYMEQLGAKVVSADVRSSAQYTRVALILTIPASQSPTRGSSAPSRATA